MTPLARQLSRLQPNVISDQINKTAHHMYALFPKSNALSPSRLDDNSRSTVKDRYGDQFAKPSLPFSPPLGLISHSGPQCVEELLLTRVRGPSPPTRGHARTRDKCDICGRSTAGAQAAPPRILPSERACRRGRADGAQFPNAAPLSRVAKRRWSRS